MNVSYMLLFNVNLVSKHSAQVVFSCPNNCKKIYGWAYRENVTYNMYTYNIEEFKLSYFTYKGNEPSSITLSIGNINSKIPFFDLEKMTKDSIMKRINRLIPFI